MKKSKPITPGRIDRVIKAVTKSNIIEAATESVKAMTKQKPTDAPPVLQMAEITAMEQSERIALFKSKDQAHSRLTVELGKLLVAMRAAMKDPSQATAILKKQGIRPGTVNTASETARVFNELVLGKKQFLAEAVFDTFTAANIKAINRCMSGVSAKRLTAGEVAELVTSRPKTYDAELESYFDHGMTVADHKEKEKADAGKAAEAAAKADAERIKAEAEKLVAGKSEGEEPTEEEEPDEESPENVVPSGIKKTVGGHAEAAPGSQTPATTDRANVTNINADGEPAKPKPGSLQQGTNLLETLGKLISTFSKEDKVLIAGELCDTVEALFADLTVDEARMAYPRLAEVHNTIFEKVQTTPAEMKAATKKPAKKAA